ncbi:MAG: DNA-3-methyladenine glycosylase family protein [Vibrio sp.]
MPKVKENKQKTAHQISCPSDFDYAFMLSFIQPRIIEGIESVHGSVYSRSFRFVLEEKSQTYAEGYFEVDYLTASNQLAVVIVTNIEQAIPEVLRRIHFMFDLETDMDSISHVLAKDPVLQKGLVDGKVPRMPKAFDEFEFCIRAILGQQVSVKAATTLAKRIAHTCDLKTPSSFPAGIQYFFPQCDDLLTKNYDGLGLTQSRIDTLNVTVNALHAGEISLAKQQDFEALSKQWTALKGIGPWTVNYLAMRGLGIQDSFPDKDLGVLKALADADGNYPSRKTVLEQAKAWQPYRAYATLCLWNGLG